MIRKVYVNATLAEFANFSKRCNILTRSKRNLTLAAEVWQILMTDAIPWLHQEQEYGMPPQSALRQQCLTLRTQWRRHRTHSLKIFVVNPKIIKTVNTPTQEQLENEWFSSKTGISAPRKCSAWCDICSFVDFFSVSFTVVFLSLRVIFRIVSLTDLQRRRNS